MLDALLERALGAHAHVLDRHAGLGQGDALDQAQVAPLLRRAALDDARLVEMDVVSIRPGQAKAPAS